MDDRDLQEIFEDLEQEMYKYYCDEVVADALELEEELYKEFPDEVVADALEEDTLPTHLGIRKSLLKANGRRKGLDNLWDSYRFDSFRRSRSYAHPCHKDDRTYRPWQRDEMKTIRGVPDNDWNDYQDFVEGILQSVYEDSEVLVEESVSYESQLLRSMLAPESASPTHSHA